MSRMIEAWDQILREAISKDFDTQQFALFQIGLVLQRHNPYVKPESDVYEETLSRDLLRLALDEKRQLDAVVYLMTLVRNYPGVADGILFAAGNAQPKILIMPLLELLAEIGHKLKGDAIYQALLALDGVLKVGGDRVQEALLRVSPSELLEKWVDSGDALISEKAGKVQRQISRLLAS